MFYKAYFKNTPEKQIIAVMHEEGFSPQLIKDKANFIYEPHHHPETKFLVCREGSMKVTVKGKIYDFEPKDKLLIATNTEHSAIVGEMDASFCSRRKWKEK